jgi:rubredoxin
MWDSMGEMTKNEIARTAWGFYHDNDVCPSCKSRDASFLEATEKLKPFFEHHGGECVVRLCGMCGASWSYQTPKQYKASHPKEAAIFSLAYRLGSSGIGKSKVNEL